METEETLDYKPLILPPFSKKKMKTGIRTRTRDVLKQEISVVVKQGVFEREKREAVKI